MLPSSFRDWANPELAPILHKTQRSANFTSEDKVKLLKAAWDAVGSEFASRHTQYEMFYAGAAFVTRGHSYRTYDWDRAGALVARLLATDSSSKRDQPMSFQPLTTDEVREFEALTRVQGSKDPEMKLSDKLTRKAKQILDAAAPGALAETARKVAERWIAGLAPLEPVLVRRPATRAPRRK